MKPERRPKSSKRRPKRRGDSRLDPRAASADYIAEHEDIRLALEAMRRSQMVQEHRVKHLLRQQPYYSVE